MKIRVLMLSLLVAASVTMAATPSSIFGTSLRITIIDELGNRVQDAEVTLYGTEEDYRNSENAIEMQKSDEKGRVTFKELESKVYFVDARKGDMNNNGAGVQTARLEENRLNKINVVIE